MLSLLAFFLTCLLFCFVSLASCATQRSSQGVQTPHRNQIRELHSSSQFFSKAWTEHNSFLLFFLLLAGAPQHLCPESSFEERQPCPQHLLHQPKQTQLLRLLLMSQKHRTAVGAI